MPPRGQSPLALLIALDALDKLVDNAHAALDHHTTIATTSPRDDDGNVINRIVAFRLQRAHDSLEMYTAACSTARTRVRIAPSTVGTNDGTLASPCTYPRKLLG